MSRSTIPQYTIQNAAERAKCHPNTLRIYEEQGLIRPHRTAGNVRMYSDADLRRVAWIRFLTQEKGVNINGVAILLHLDQELGGILEKLDTGRAE